MSTRELRATLQRVAPGEDTRSSASLGALIGQPGRVLLEHAGLSAAVIAALASPDRKRIAQDRAWVERERVHLIDALSADSPPLLAEIPNAPALIYVQGDGQRIS